MLHISPSHQRFIIPAILLLITVSSGETILVAGRVTDYSGEPIPFVEVYSATTHLGTTTDREGRFILILDDQPVDRLVVSHSAFTMQEVSLDTVSAEDMRIRLQRRIYQFKPVIVEGNLYGRQSLALPVSHRVITIDDSPNSGNSVAERLGRRGIQIRDYGGPAGLKTISSPTGYAEHILVMVEDLPINSPQNGVFDLSILPADLFSHGEFYDGQGSSLYGSNAVGGTLNLMLDRQKSNLRMRSGSLGEKGISGRIHKELNLLRTAVYGNSFESTADYRENNDFSQRAVAFQASLPLTKQWTARSFALQSHVDRGIAGTLQFPSPSARKENGDFLLLATLRGISTAGQTKITAGVMKSREHFTDPDWIVNSRHRIDSWQVRAVHRFREFLSVRNTLSLETTTNHVRSDDAGNHQEDLTAVGLLSQIRISPRLTVSPSLRSDWNSRQDKVIATGNLAMLWSRNEGLLQSFAFSAGSSYRNPTFNDLYWEDPWGYSVGNLYLKPEKGNSAEASLHLRPVKPSWLSIRIRGYYFFTENLIQWTPDESWVYMPHNLKKSESYGGSLSVTVSPEDLPVTISILSERNNSRVLSKGDDHGKRLLYVPARSHWAELSYSRKSINFQLRYQLLGKRRYSYSTDLLLRPYERLDANISLTSSRLFGVETSIALGCRNLQDHSNLQSVYDYPEPGRTVYSRLSLELP
ncbi:MAG: TonB-dependent receptor [Candidatus Marinimicrobia bacterium]|jgi:outer membrane cobalamin receptor|nr:TonB-dependent receptor [Candidatus Neomarinimicrobiota bacterium]MDP6593644.1 TonB-dependent receptor [Candidatus Neomarinimicrobiota bacterium]MDP6836194.1 TonB-dependent receptor [Candidatus Neomarinimicrobiota bacterium]|tara:strand:+ start:11329 stop:13419 length:2091 start_codon:yes stop_codon:yes gene_type:complete